MRLSKTTTDLCNTYRLTAQDVYFAHLAVAGCTRPEAYGAAFNCFSMQEGTLRNKAAQLIREKPGLAKLIADLIQERYHAPTTGPDWETYRQMTTKGGAPAKPGKRARTNEASSDTSPSSSSQDPDTEQGWSDDESTAENLARIIKGEIRYMRGKEKIDSSLKYAKLIGVDPEVTDTTHYYLPLSCCQCALYLREQGKIDQSNGE